MKGIWTRRLTNWLRPGGGAADSVEAPSTIGSSHHRFHTVNDGFSSRRGIVNRAPANFRQFNCRTDKRLQQVRGKRPYAARMSVVSSRNATMV